MQSSTAPRSLTPPLDDASDAACAYWVERAETVAGAASVLPAGRWLRYHAWTHRMLQRWTLARLDRPRYRRILDLGCGRGEWAALFAPRADEVFACDVAEPFVLETRRRLAALPHPAAQVDQADLRDYRFPAGIDLAYVGAVLCYLTDEGVRDVLYRLRLSTTPQALVIVRDYCTINLGRPATNLASGFSIHRRPAELVRLAESVGLRCEAVRSSPGIYAEEMGNAITRWPLRLAWRLATLHWTRASHTLVFRSA